MLIAGDGRLPVFDNAVQRFQARLQNEGVAPAGIQRLSAAPSVFAKRGIRSASLDHVLDAIRAMHPEPGQGCLVYVTSHGAPDRGIALSLTGEFLSPRALSRALAAGCGDAPTVAVVSGCFTGGFAKPPMTRANRVILTAARADRASFGCGAGYTYTVYDRCLLRAMGKAGDWRGVYADVKTCVEDEEHASHFTPSEPQAYFGPAVDGLPLPSVRGSVSSAPLRR